MVSYMRNHQVKEYAVWQDGVVIAYVKMTVEEAEKKNSEPNAKVYYGFDKFTDPDKYKTE